MAGHPPPAAPTSGPASWRARCAEAPALLAARPPGPRRLPALLLPPLRGRAGRPAARTTRWELFSDLHPHASRSRPASAGSASTGALGHRTLLDHRRARLRRRAAAPAVRRRHRGRAVPAGTTAPTRGELSQRAADRRGAGAGRWPTTPPPTASTSPSRVAYADSTSDLPMLEAVGFPVAVNPETRWPRIARKRGWLVEHFDPAPGASKPLLPLAAGRLVRPHEGELPCPQETVAAPPDSSSTSTVRRRRSCSTTARGSSLEKLPAGRGPGSSTRRSRSSRSTTPTRAIRRALLEPAGRQRPAARAAAAGHEADDRLRRHLACRCRR